MKIGEALIKSGLINADQLDQALENQKKSSERLGDIVLKMGLVSVEDMAPVLAKYFHIQFIKVKDIYKDIKQEVITKVPAELAHRFTVIPVGIEDQSLVVAMYDPLDLVALDTLRIKTGMKIRPVMSTESEIIEAIEYCYHNTRSLKESVDSFSDMDMSVSQGEDESQDQQFAASDKPVVQYVQSLIVQAVYRGASDILIQPKQDVVDLRYRIDGVLHKIEPPPKTMISAITARVKILSNLDIAERRLPQDGRFRIKMQKTEVDIRTSSFPTIYGESIVMRLLNTSAPLVGLDQLGFEKHALTRYKELLQKPYGMILVTGPTGSGKTTTLYTSLNEIKSTDKNILTLEDPVEYRLPFIQQSQVNPTIGFTFARGLRSVLRQDPDVIMVGEIRDRETAEIVIHSALTGHLVFSTLHTNDAAGAAVRLINMGVEPYLISSSLLGIMAQRLVRVICPHCKKTFQVQAGDKELIPFGTEITEYSKGTGCPKCFQSGYKGRQGIYELLVMEQDIRDCILARASSEEIRKVAQQKGMKTLRESGIEKVRQGLTTPEEILRITLEGEE